MLSVFVAALGAIRPMMYSSCAYSRLERGHLNPTEIVLSPSLSDSDTYPPGVLVLESVEALWFVYRVPPGGI